MTDIFFFPVFTNGCPYLATLPLMEIGVVPNEDCVFRYAQDTVHVPLTGTSLQITGGDHFKVQAFLFHS